MNEWPKGDGNVYDAVIEYDFDTKSLTSNCYSFGLPCDWIDFNSTKNNVKETDEL